MRVWFCRLARMAEDGAGGGAAGAAAQVAAAAPAASVAFAETLPEDIRGEAAFKDIKDIGTLAKSYLNAQKLIGVPPDRIVRLPDAADSPDWAGVYARLGRPETADKYELKAPEGVAEDAALKAAFLKTAHDNGLNTRQAKALFDMYASEGQTRATAAAAEVARRADAQVAGLKTEWGAAFDQKLTEAKAALQHYGDTELVAYLNETGMGNDPRLIKVFARLGAQLREDGIVKGDSAATGNAMSPAEAQQQINALHGDASFMKAYTTKQHPGHADALARMTRLYEFKAAAAA